MDFEFSEEDKKFQKEVREFMKAELPADWPGVPWMGEPAKETPESLDFARNFTKKMRDKGWLTMHWPKQYGGEDAPISKRIILAEEVGYWKAPQLDIYGPSIVGMTLINFGTEEQKKMHLPKILEGNVLWTQGFSEPNAGSDLGSLQMTGEIDGDDYVVNGQKTWSSAAHLADWMFVLVRTDTNAPSKHKGISLLYVDIKTPGISITPMLNIAGGHTFNDVYFDSVRIPRSNIIGKENDGFKIAMASLDYERTEGMNKVGNMRRRLEDLVDYINKKKAESGFFPRETLFRERLAKMRVEVEVLKLLSYRMINNEMQGKPVTYEASMSFAFYGDLAKRLSRLSVQVLGMYGQLGPECEFAPMYGMEQSHYLYTPAFSLAGGTTEIQRSIVAWRGLGMPR